MLRICDYYFTVFSSSLSSRDLFCQTMWELHPDPSPLNTSAAFPENKDCLLQSTINTIPLSYLRKRTVPCQHLISSPYSHFPSCSKNVIYRIQPSFSPGISFSGCFLTVPCDLSHFPLYSPRGSHAVPGVQGLAVPGVPLLVKLLGYLVSLTLF